MSLITTVDYFCNIADRDKKNRESNKKENLYKTHNTKENLKARSQIFSRNFLYCFSCLFVSFLLPSLFSNRHSQVVIWNKYWKSRERSRTLKTILNIGALCGSFLFLVKQRVKSEKTMPTEQNWMTAKNKTRKETTKQTHPKKQKGNAQSKQTRINDEIANQKNI